MSLYQEYLIEREGVTTFENLSETGFIAYKFIGNECHIKDIYVQPDSRHQHIAKYLADEITGRAKYAGCKYLIATVCPGANGCHESMLVILSYGFKLLKSELNLVYFIKEI